MAIKRNQNKKTLVTIITIIFVLNLLFIPAYYAQAQWVVSDPVTGQATTIKNIKDFLKKMLVGTASVSLINAADYIMQKLAYDSAVALATGGKGAMPLFSTKGWGDYFKDVSLNAVGEFVGSLSENFEQFDLCNPGPASLKVRIQTNLAKPYLPVGEGPEPRCTWNEISSNWDDFTEEFTTGEVLSQTGVMFETGQSPLSVTLEAGKKLSQQVYEAERLKELERMEGQGFIGKTGIISGEVQTPSQVIAQTAKDLIGDNKEWEKERSSIVNQSLSAGATQILYSALGTFVNTLAGKLLDKVFNKGLLSLSDLKKRRNRGALINPEFSLTGTREIAQDLYSDFITPPIKEVDVYDLVTDFSTCPSQFVSPNNCVIDQSFATAIRRETSGEPVNVREAIDQGLLRGDWPLISSYDRARNADTHCYSYGYCYSNLVKLREARIIPIGWEIAAQKSGTVTSQATLRQVVDGFYDCGIDADGNPVADDEHPWCHLIDPNWVLKYPLTQCRASVYGPTLLTGDNSVRSETCVDAPTCIAEDDEGNCVGGWGYCLKEKNTWHFGGDSCPANFESCLTLEDRDGEQSSYLLNTVNYSVCNSDNAGCRWYSREPLADDDWNISVSYDEENYSLIATDSAIYFDKDVRECSSAEAGCTEFIRASEAGITLNLVSNPSFEQASETDPGFPNAWQEVPGGVATYSTDGTNTYDGLAAVMPGEGGISQEVVLNPSRFYTFSLFAKNSDGANFDASVTVKDSDGVPADLTGYYYTGVNCQQSGPTILLNDITPPENFARYYCTFTTPPASASPDGYFLGEINISAVGGPAGDAWVDAIQLEENETPTGYHEGIGLGGDTVYLRKPPASLGCTGTDADPDECDNYLRICSPLDVGCKRFYPVDDTPSLTAVTTAEDECPAQCVGYETFREEPTQWSTDARFPLYFIPDTAGQCLASEVGCDEFTNLDAPEVGGEATNYFTEIRACQLPADDSESFYTWEGSDTTGFQLKTWVLKGSNQDNGPCTNLAPDGTCDDPAPGTAEYAVRDCSDVFETDADCREFYDTAGDLYYRYYSDTIISTDECYRYRKTINNGQEDCEATGGRWTEANECVYYGYPPESQVCPADAAGCRAYTGATSRNIEEEFFDDFEDAATDWTGGSISTESVLLDGHSLKVLPGTSISKGWDIEQGETYTMNFWAKGQGEATVSMRGTTLGTVTLNPEWNSFDIGPIRVEEEGEITSISISGFTQVSYIDNIAFNRVSDHIYLIRDSWYTPLVCDTNNQGVYIPQAQLGCSAYTDDFDDNYYLKSFSRLCNEDAVGCEGFIDTYNSSSYQEQTFNSGEGGAEVVVPADTVSYYVYDELYTCEADAKGCEAMGRPIISQDGRSVLDWEEAYLVNNPDSYDTTLCLTEEAFCEEYDSEIGKYYFKDPGNKTCVYREKVKIAGIEYNGWFIAQTDTPCYPTFLGGGNVYGIWRNGDDDYDAWYGECPQQYSLCTKFLDPSDTGKEYPDGQEYYYLNNDALDDSCSTVSKAEGCALFDNTNNSTKDWNSWATYLTSQDNNFEGVAPIDCRSSDSPYCRQVCKYIIGVIDPSMPGSVVTVFGHNCQDASDCQEYDSVAKSCENINDYNFNCRKYNEDLGEFQWGADCETSDCPSGWECVDTSQALRQNDSNMKLRVLRDRECGEWLSCRSSVSVWDPEASEYKNVCTNLGLCNQYSTSVESGECVNFIESEHSGDILTEAQYVSRDVSWEGMDYSGYSIPNYYPIDEISPVDLSPLTDAANPDLRLGYIGEDCTAFYQECGEVNSMGNRGVCIPPGDCIYSINGESLPAADNESELYDLLSTKENRYRLVGQSCRAYPEETAPFPSSIAEWENGSITTVDPKFKRANICQQTVWQDLDGDNERDDNELTYQDCECSYKKATYNNGAATRYYSINENSIPMGICLNGPRDSQSCIPGVEYDPDQPADSDQNLQACGAPNQGGSCQALERTDSFIGLEGQCLERDLSTSLNGDPESHACSLWYPSFILSGGQDIYNLYQEAGYNPGNTGRYWCLLGRGLRTPAGVDELGEDYMATTRSKKRLVSTGSNDKKEYSEKFFAATPKEKYFKDDIIAIEMKPVGANKGDWPNGRNTHTEDFYEDGGHILSRQNEVNLQYGYTAWQVSWNLPDDIEFPSEAPPVFIDSNFAYNFTEDESGHPTDSCANDYDPQNYFAVRAVFRPDGSFKGFWTVSCDHSPRRGRVWFDVVFHMADQCLVVGQAVSDEGGNKAYTDRLYQASNYPLTVGSEYLYGQPFAPFGSAQSFEAPMTPIARDVRVEPWMVGDGLGEQSHIGSPDLSLLPEKFTLAGSSLGCMGACADDTFGDLNFQPNISRPLTAFSNLFAKVYDLFAWFSGNEEYECVPPDGWTSTARYYIPCGEEGEGNCGTVGPCKPSSVCQTGPFKGNSCSHFYHGYCRGRAAACKEETTADGGTALLCVDSFKVGASCEDVDGPGPLDEDYTIIDTSEEINVPSDIGDDFCDSVGHCIDWAQHISGADEEFKCYGGINHGIACNSESDCNESALNGTGCVNGFCEGGVFSALGYRTTCEGLPDCQVSGSQCVEEDVRRYDGGILNGAICGGEFGNYSHQTFDCVEAEHSGVSTRGFVNKGCGGDADFPCQSPDDCEDGACEYIASSYFDFQDIITLDNGNDVAGEVGNPPTIAAIDFTSCDQVTGTCRVARTNAFDINNWYFGVVTGQEQLKTALRFYAWADHDQMPIVGRTIDWGDGSPMDRTTVSKYKNQKPYCGSQVFECSNYEGLTCKTNADCPGGTGSCGPTDTPHFGNSGESCSQGYFHFEHTYLCHDDIDLPDCGFDVSPGSSYGSIPATGCKTDTACFYRPRVQVLDNWGWCNGSCSDTPGCYSRYCKMTEDGRPHWTFFDGYIKVNK